MNEIGKFILGFRRFQNDFFRNDAQLFSELKDGQNPKVLIIGCCDSRVDPGLLTGSAPGDMFVIRNVANLVPPYEADLKYHGVSAGIEFAVKSLEVSHIIVLGHSNCGGIKAMFGQEAKESEFVGQWMNIAAQAREHVLKEMSGASPEELQSACEKASVLVSLDNLLSFPFVRERVESGLLMLHGWYFDLKRGELSGYLAETGSFELLVPNCELPESGCHKPFAPRSEKSKP